MKSTATFAVISAKSIIVILLMICLLKMPYGYYQIMRIAVTVLSCWLAYFYWGNKNALLAVLCGFVALLFQPFFKLAFNKKDWQNIDLWLSVAIAIWILFDVLFMIKRRI